MNSFYSEKELIKIGLKSFGNNVLISRKASLYDVQNISIGDRVRIDDFCILSGKIKIGNFVHISAYSALYARNGIEIGNYAGISPRCTIFSATDDFSGNYMIGPLLPEEVTNVTGGLVKIEDYVQVGSHSLVMPSVTIGEGSVVGAMSFVTRNLSSWKICFGVPAKEIKDRSKKVLELVKTL